MAKKLENTLGKPDVIAGVATGAIGIGALVAELGLPFVYVRLEPKTWPKTKLKAILKGAECGCRRFNQYWKSSLAAVEPKICWCNSQRNGGYF